MNHTSEVKFDIREEFKIVPKVMFVVAALVFMGMQAFLMYVLRHSEGALWPSMGMAFGLGVLGGSVLALVILLVSYVNQDAMRRGMNSLLWTVLVIFIPNAIGFIIYFVVRQPIRATCPQCGATVNPAFNYCPKCKFNLHPACPQCHRAIEVGAAFCPYCSAELKGLA